jgi:hypothetical protein
VNTYISTYLHRYLILILLSKEDHNLVVLVPTNLPVFEIYIFSVVICVQLYHVNKVWKISYEISKF